MTVDFTIAIITYNGATRIPEVLECLLKQEINSINWEVLVVDNNSEDNTREVVLQYGKNWRTDSQLRYTFESRQGATYARYRAVAEAKSKSLIGFLDDDNLPKENWVAESVDFGIKNPNIGAYGGIIHAQLDIDPPSYFRQMKNYLTICNRGSKPFQYKRSHKIRRIPPAPGVVIRKEAWQEAMPAPEKLLISGRDPRTMAAGEDAEMMLYIQNSSWEVWHNPKMEIWHHIYAHRLQEDYLLKLARGYGLSNHLTRLARYYPWQRPWLQLLRPAYFIRGGLRVMMFYYKNRRDLDRDFSKQCELQCKIGQMYSPFLGIYTNLIHK